MMEVVAEEITVESQALDTTLSTLHPLLDKLPSDLYIPPHALHVILEIFAGPLDLLLYLIKKHNLDILDIPVAKITEQYIQYIELMEILEVELAADYLEMAAMLAEIKSRMLLPKPTDSPEDEEDPRAELIRKLQEYEQIKTVAMELEALPQSGRDFFYCSVNPALPELQKPQPELNLNELLLAFKDVLLRHDLETAHNIERETLSVKDKISYILKALTEDNFIMIAEFFNYNEGRLGIIVTLLAVLEMAREWIIEVVQAEAFAPIYIRLKHHD